MSITAIVGANWGDEGKGKITDCLAADSDFVVRFQGGNNAGHTIINDYGKFALHLLPSGVFYPNIVNVLGTGVALNIRAFLKERSELMNRGVPEPILRISSRAQVVLPFHLLFDEYEEERLGDKKFGSTKCGIAPFYSDKYLKLGVQVSDLYDATILRGRISSSLVSKNVLLEHLYEKDILSVDQIVDGLCEDAEELKPYICDTTSLLRSALKENKNILMEGQLGALRDPDHGIYPFPTSSSTLAGFSTVGAGVPPYEIKRIIAVAKSYSSCVGTGPFVSEIHGPEAHELRERGGDAGEYGATTGRPRRMGWFDLVATRYGCQVQGATEVALSLLDVLGYLESIPICTAYDIDGKITNDFPTPAQLMKAKPVLETIPGWKCDISSIRNYMDLPHQTREYIEYIEKEIDTPIKYVSVGPKRDAIIQRT